MGPLVVVASLVQWVSGVVLAYVIMAQMMPNDAALMQRVETLIYQAIVD